MEKRKKTWLVQPEAEGLMPPEATEKEIPSSLQTFQIKNVIITLETFEKKKITNRYCIDGTFNFNTLLLSSISWRSFFC
jgi:hypothetical protein